MCLSFGNAGEDNVSTMLFRVIILDCADCWTGGRLLGRRSRRASRRRGQSFSLGDADKPVTLPSRMIGWLRAAVELAGGIESLLVGESRLPSRPAAFCVLGAGRPSGCSSSTVATCRLVEGGIGALHLWLL